MAEIYVPFSWFEPMWLETLGFVPEGDGWKLTEAGETAIGGKLPVNASGGVLSSNPIGASGMLRFAEAAHAGDGPRPASTRSTAPASALGHAYGGGSQFFAMWVVGSARARLMTGGGRAARTTCPAPRAPRPARGDRPCAGAVR